MKTASRVLASLAPIALLLGCGTEADRSIVGSPLADHTANFSAWSEPVSLGPAINTSFDEQQPALSQDGLSLYFGSTRPPGAVGMGDVWVSHRACVGTPTDCPWEPAENIGAPVNTQCIETTQCNESAPALSRDGHWLFMLTNRPGGFGSSDIWASWRKNVHDDFGWQAPVNLGSGINTTGFEGGPGYFENDDLGVPQLYFNHNDQPAAGGGDIFVSEQAADGFWGPASPVVELNSAASDQRPSVAPSGLDIYFFSNRAGSLPDENGVPTTDIWVSTRESVFDPWSSPTNLGPPISSGLPENHPFIFSRARTEELYFVRTLPGSGRDLFVSTRTREGNGP